MSSPEPLSLKFWTTFSEVGLVLVIIGVIGESAELIARLIGWWRRLYFSERLGRWLLLVEFIFWVVLVSGLGTEFLGSHNAIRISEAENARLHNTTAGALKLAAEANDRASTNELARVEGEKELILLRKQYIELVAVVAPRVFQVVDQDRAVTNLSRFKGLTVHFFCEEDRESKQTVKQIEWVVERAGWTNSTSDMPFQWLSKGSEIVPSADGIVVDVASLYNGPIDPRFPDYEATRIAGQALVDELNSSGMKARMKRPDTHSEILPRHTVFIYVGPPPIPFQRVPLGRPYLRDPDKAFR